MFIFSQLLFIKIRSGDNDRKTVTWILLHAGENDLMLQCFRGGQNKIVLCETFKYNKKPTETNHRCQQKTTLIATKLKKADKKINSMRQKL